MLVPELNAGQLRFLLQGKFARELTGFNKIQGKPFIVTELVEKIQKYVG